MRYLLLALALLWGRAEADIDRQIDSTKKSIQKKRIERKKIERRLDQIARDITLQKRRVAAIEKEIASCKLKIAQQRKHSVIKKSELQKIEKLYNALKTREKSVSKKMIDLLSKELSLQILLYGDTDDNASLAMYETNVDNIILQQIYQNYNTLLKEKFDHTRKRFVKLNKNMALVRNELAKIAYKIDELKSEARRLKRLQSAKKKTIQNLNAKKVRYARKLARIRKEQDQITAVLNRLQITKREKESSRISGTPSIEKVRQIGSSYQQTKVVPYHGPKTIAPLSSYTVAQRFGNYTDPLYHIKIFNESVVLRSTSSDAKVRSVMDGKVIYASKTPMLDNVVIIKHGNDLHTIYAHLARIAPTVKVGRHIKRGYVIGRVDRELTFEVTKNEAHIDPLQLIR